MRGRRQRSKNRTLAVICVIIGIIFFASFPCYGADVNVYYRCESKSNAKKIALTFDDGPHPRITPKILSILDEYGIGDKATFFIIGQNAQNYPDAMRLIVDSGCEIGNHTFSHKNLRTMNSYEIEREFYRCRQTLEDNFSVSPRLLRPPEGYCSDVLYNVGEGLESDIVLWSIDTLDWAHTSAEVIVKNVLSNAKGGDIILMHDYVSGKNGTCEALRVIIPELQKRGFEFVKVSELIADAE